LVDVTFRRLDME